MGVALGTVQALIEQTTGGIGGSGTAGTLPKFSNPTTLTNSVLSESGGELLSTADFRIQKTMPAVILQDQTSGSDVLYLQSKGGAFQVYNATDAVGYLEISGRGHTYLYNKNVSINTYSVVLGRFADPTNPNGLFLHSDAESTHYNWRVATQAYQNNGFEISPSTTIGGTTWDTGASFVLYRDVSGFLNLGVNVDLVTATPAAGAEIVETSKSQLRLTYTVGTQYTDFETNSAGVLIISPSGDQIVPDVDNTITLGTATLRWADVRSTLINGADYAMENGLRMLENELFAGQEKGWAIAYDPAWPDDKAISENRDLAEGRQPLFAVTESYIEYRGRRLTPEILDRLLALA